MKKNYKNTKKKKSSKEEGDKNKPVFVKSKKIKKINQKKSYDKFAHINKKKDDPNTKLKLSEIENFEDFIRTDKSLLEKIKKRTIEKIKLDKEMIKKALKSLYTHHMKIKSLEDYIFLEVKISQLPTQFPMRSFQINIPNSFLNIDKKFCIIVKDPSKIFKNKIENLKLKNITKILSFSKFKEKLKTNQEKKAFLDSYDHFFCDYKIYNSILKSNKNLFFKKKKIPFPIDCDKVPLIYNEKFKGDYQNYLNDFSSYSYFIMGNTKDQIVKIGHLGMDIKQIGKNLINAVYDSIPIILRHAAKHTHIQSLNIKTSKSISLPFWNNINFEDNIISLE